jgi:hypothetical protein
MSDKLSGREIAGDAVQNLIDNHDRLLSELEKMTAERDRWEHDATNTRAHYEELAAAYRTMKSERDRYFRMGISMKAQLHAAGTGILEAIKSAETDQYGAKPAGVHSADVVPGPTFLQRRAAG